MINWNASKKDARLIAKIAKRASKIAAESSIPDYPVQDAEMDITAVHLNDIRLRLKDLAEADDANFGHDVFGIRKFINRRNGKLEGHFVPRLHVREAA